MGGLLLFDFLANQSARDWNCHLIHRLPILFCRKALIEGPSTTLADFCNQTARGRIHKSVVQWFRFMASWLFAGRTIMNTRLTWEDGFRLWLELFVNQL